jgi:hypothetical protein
VEEILFVEKAVEQTTYAYSLYMSSDIMGLTKLLTSNQTQFELLDSTQSASGQEKKSL